MAETTSLFPRGWLHTADGAPADDMERLGSCAAHPCACVYVDRTRAGNRRYCCDLCNDRAASAAYRHRHSAGHEEQPGAGRHTGENA